jgi:hypothetical protein
LKNDIDASLSAVADRRPAAQPNQGYGVTKKGIHKLWPVLDVLKSLLRDGLLDADIFRTFISCRI